MLTTQEFANLCNTTKKTIIHYDKIGLLKPKRRRGIARIYEPKQVLVFQKIILLKSFGLRLEEIKKYLPQNRILVDLFKEKRKGLEKQKKFLENRIKKAAEFIESLTKGKLLIAPKIKQVKPYAFYGLEKTGRYIDIKDHQKEIFTRIGDSKYQGIGLTVFYNNQYSPQESQMMTGVLTDNKKPKKIKGVKLINVPQHKVVYYLHIGPYSYMSYIWQFLNKFIVENKLKQHPDLVCREFYLIGQLHLPNDPNNWVTELQIPIK